MSGLTVGAMRSPPIVVGSFSAFTVVTAACGIWLRRRLQRLQSLRATVYATALSALVFALAAAILAGQLMLIQPGQLRLFLDKNEPETEPTDGASLCRPRQRSRAG